MATKLGQYQAALGHLEERRIRSLSEACERRRVLDSFWDKATAYCLERRAWNFAFRAAQLTPDSGQTPQFGFTKAYAHPADWVRTVLISGNPGLSPPLTAFREEAGFWFTDVEPLFVQHVSNDPLYGMDLGRWPESFSDFHALRLARLACKRVTGSDALLLGPQGLIKQEEKSSRDAGALCALNEPIKFPPPGRWVTSRRGFGQGGDDPMGGSLIG